MGCPSYLVKAGFGSKLSTCDKPPFMNRKMTRFAFGLKLGLSISQGAGPTVLAALAIDPTRLAKPSMPKPPPIRQSASRRVTGCPGLECRRIGIGGFSFMNRSLIYKFEFVRTQQHASVFLPGR